MPGGPKHILVLNSGCQVRGRPVSWDGGVYLHFLEITRIEDTQKLRGAVYDDVVWVRYLPWGHRDREQIEFAVRSRMVRRNGS